MATLNYSGEQTVDVSTAKSLIEQGVTLHNADSPVSIDSGSLRLTDDGQIRFIVSASAAGDYSKLQALEGEIAQAAVDLGFEPDVETATESVQL